jgi:hypothetical protein
MQQQKWRRERASCNVCGEVDGEDGGVRVSVCGSGHCNIRSICFDLFGRARVLGFRDEIAGSEECRSGASFDSAGNESSSDKSNIATKAGAVINNVDGSGAGDRNLRARKKAAVAVVKRSEVTCVTSTVVSASMESMTTKCSEAHGDWFWDIVNTVCWKTRQSGGEYRGGHRSRSGRLSAEKKGGQSKAQKERDFAMSNCATLQSSERSKERARNG